MSRRFIDAQIAGRRWRRLNDDVVALHNGPLSRDERHAAAYLSAQRPAALCSLTAAELWGLKGFETDDVHLVVRRGARVVPVPDVSVVVHESRRFDGVDIATAYEPARVSLDRALVDAAVWSGTPAQAGRIVAAGVQQRLTTPASLLAELERAGKVRHRRPLLLLLHDLAGGAQALSEVEFMRFCRRHGLPMPVMNVRIDARGRRRYLDATLSLTGGRPVHIEVDGGVHLTLAARWEDTRRDNDLGIRGVHPLRFPSIAIYTDDRFALAQIRAALADVSR